MPFPASILAAAVLFSSSPTNPAAGETTAFTRSQIIENWGWILAQEKKLIGIELSDPELALFLKGFSEGLTNQPPPSNLQKAYSDVGQLAKARRKKMVRAITQKNEAEAAVYLAQIQTNAGLVGLPDHVWYEIVQSGEAKHPKLQQTVNVHYTAHLMDGTEFSQMGPVDMVLVTNRNVCRGWADALQQIGPGGALKLYVPPPLSEADADAFGVEPGTLTIFDVDLLAVKDTAPDDLQSASMPPAPEPPPPLPSGLTTAQILETWGWLVERESHADRFALTTDEADRLITGVASGIQGSPAPAELPQIYPLVEKFVTEEQAKAASSANQKRLAEMAALFADLKTDTNFIELPDGLRYEVIKPGIGPYPKPGQGVTVHYTGRLINGTVFDSTEVGPLDIDLDKVIRGWSEGVQKINRGGKIKLYIPPALGYGDVATSGIPPDSTLIYEVELLEIKDGEPQGSPSGSEK